jgi:hypothetical protein
MKKETGIAGVLALAGAITPSFVGAQTSKPPVNGYRVKQEAHFAYHQETHSEEIFHGLMNHALQDSEKEFMAYMRIHTADIHSSNALQHYVNISNEAQAKLYDGKSPSFEELISNPHKDNHPVGVLEVAAARLGKNVVNNLVGQGAVPTKSFDALAAYLEQENPGWTRALHARITLKKASTSPVLYNAPIVKQPDDHPESKTILPDVISKPVKPIKLNTVPVSDELKITLSEGLSVLHSKDNIRKVDDKTYSRLKKILDGLQSKCAEKFPDAKMAERTDFFVYDSPLLNAQSDTLYNERKSAAAIIFTSKMLDELTDEEIKSVMGHEFFHQLLNLNEGMTVQFIPNIAQLKQERKRVQKNLEVFEREVASDYGGVQLSENPAVRIAVLTKETEVFESEYAKTHSGPIPNSLTSGSPHPTLKTRIAIIESAALIEHTEKNDHGLNSYPMPIRQTSWQALIANSTSVFLTLSR